MNPADRQLPSILFVDDESAILSALRRATRKLSACCFFAESGEEGLEILEREAVDIVVSDMKMPGMSGVEFLSAVAVRYPETIRFVLTGHAEYELVMGAVNDAKVYGYLHKPWVNEELQRTLENALQVRALLLERLLLQQMLSKHERFNRSSYHGFIGDSSPMQLVYNTIEMAAPSNAPVFITGPSGTGKEVAALAIHAASKRADAEFVAINCAAIPRDLIESELFGHVKGAFSGAVQNREGAASKADGGTLFLDELAEMDIDLQAKLLRFIQTGSFQKVGSNELETVDIRFVCATNKEPELAIDNGALREDLYYRLNVINISMPALSERDWDTLMLAEHFLDLYASAEQKVFEGFTSEAEKLLFHYHWPGNVRQLQNVINSAVILLPGPVISALELGRLLKLGDEEREALVSQPLPYVEKAELHVESPAETGDAAAGAAAPMATAALQIKPLAEMERDIIEIAIDQQDGNVVEAARQLAVSPSTLYRKIQSWEGT